LEVQNIPIQRQSGESKAISSSLLDEEEKESEDSKSNYSKYRTY